MCRAKSGKGPARRCPSHSNPVIIANRNTRRRAKYAERKNTGAVTENSAGEITPFISGVKLIPESEVERCVQAGEFEPYEHNSYVKRIFGEDGSSALYIPASDVLWAITNDISDYGLGYRLLAGDGLEKMRRLCSPLRLKELDASIDSGDPMDQGYVVKNILYDKFGSVPEAVAFMLSDDKNAAKIRDRFFNYLDRPEQEIKNSDGSIAGYAFSYRAKNPLTLDEMNPALIVSDHKSDDFRDYMWAKNAVEDVFQSDIGAYDVQVRDEYFTHVERLVKKHGIPQRGAYRLVFDAGDTVIKIPLNADGLKDNAREAQHYAGKVEDYHEGVPMASCQLEYNERGMPYLVMEKVDMVQVHRYDRPAWAKSIDNFQFGRSRITGEFVAYDL